MMRLFTALLLALQLAGQTILFVGSPVTGGGGASCPTGTLKYPASAGSGTTLEDTVGSNDATFDATNPLTWVGDDGVEVGSSDFAEAAALNVNLVTTAFSVCGVIKPVSYSTRYGIVADFEGGHGWAVTISIDGTCLGELIYQGGGSPQRDVIKFGCSSPSTETVYQFCVSKPAGRDGTAVKASVNGSMVTPTVTTDAFDGSENITYTGNNDLRVGTSQQASFGSSSNGQDVDWLKIFVGHELSNDEHAACCVEAETEEAGQGVTVTCP